MNALTWNCFWITQTSLVFSRVDSMPTMMAIVISQHTKKISHKRCDIWDFFTFLSHSSSPHMCHVWGEFVGKLSSLSHRASATHNSRNRISHNHIKWHNTKTFFNFSFSRHGLFYQSHSIFLQVISSGDISQLLVFFTSAPLFNLKAMIRLRYEDLNNR